MTTLTANVHQWLWGLAPPGSGPLGLNETPRDVVEALPEVESEAPSDRGLRQMFPADPPQYVWVRQN